jgi:hypothetical protein
MNTLRPLAIAAAVGLTAMSGTSFAQEARIIQIAIPANDSVEDRIALSGKLRMLSQRIPSAACHLVSGVDPEGSVKLLSGSITEFERILDGLEFGDSDLNINSAETRRMTVTMIHETREVWKSFKVAVDAVLQGNNTKENLQIVLDQNLAVLGSAQSLVSELVEQYSNSPNAVQAELFLVDIAGRQRMLTQKMSKESCMLASDTGTADTLNDLQSTMQVFESSLDALRFGLPELGIRKPPTDEISVGLNEILDQWTTVKPILDAILTGSNLNSDAQIQKFHGLNEIMTKMDQVVQMYIETGSHDA